MTEGLILMAELILMFLLLRSVKNHSKDKRETSEGFFAYLDKKAK
jgi:hypothetical protein